MDMRHDTAFRVAVTVEEWTLGENGPETFLTHGDRTYYISQCDSIEEAEEIAEAIAEPPGALPVALCSSPSKTPLEIAQEIYIAAVAVNISLRGGMEQEGYKRTADECIHAANIFAAHAEGKF